MCIVAQRRQARAVYFVCIAHFVVFYLLFCRKHWLENDTASLAKRKGLIITKLKKSCQSIFMSQMSRSDFVSTSSGTRLLHSRKYWLHYCSNALLGVTCCRRNEPWQIILRACDLSCRGTVVYFGLRDKCLQCAEEAEGRVALLSCDPVWCTSWVAGTWGRKWLVAYMLFQIFGISLIL